MAFLLGVNYWPRKKAMYWWKYFDKQEVQKDFEQIKSLGFTLVRIFLIWEDFQPNPNQISNKALKNLKAVVECAAKNNLKLIPTFFTGHMSGINWIPDWALDRKGKSSRFSISKQKISYFKIKNIFEDNLMLKAQLLQIKKVVSKFHGSKAIFAWDLSNQFYHLEVKSSAMAVKKWCSLLTKEIKKYDSKAKVTCGASDLRWEITNPKNFLSNDFICVHSYFPIHNKKEADELINAGIPSRECKKVKSLIKKPVLLEEFGFPTAKGHSTQTIKIKAPDKTFECLLLSEKVVARYYEKILSSLPSICFGALAWCWSDYAKELWKKPPFNTYVHERYFGITKADGSLKPAAKTINKFARKINLKK